jgi:hypothetical protein
MILYRHRVGLGPSNRHDHGDSESEESESGGRGTRAAAAGISENQNANLMDWIFAIKAAVLSFENCASNMACRRGLKIDEQKAKDLSNFTKS